jgi:hypothetical protein
MGAAETIAEAMSACGDLRIVGQETLSGTSCFVVEAKTRYGTFTVWIAPDKGYNALKYTVCKNTGDILYDDVRVEDRGITECVCVVDAIEVGQIDGVFLPISGQQTGRAGAGDEWVVDDHVVVKRREIVLHPDFVALGAFKIDFPEGTDVTHEDIPGREFRWTGGKFVPEMDDFLLKRLLGRPLPNLDEFIEGFDPESAAGKRILVCFWDMQQRSSRHGIVALRDKAKQLGNQDLVIIAVQASKTDPVALHGWIADHGIPFAMGMISANEEKTRNRWGVKSLPWLILADAEHHVVSEGFGLGDLDKELEKMGAKK